ncbi:hypothetical protein Bhyg_05587 [Pseudolycoriella hygida]|uniref:Uncharacterized protein n=1 Tax=Pseudolycoriella hygida TaxID=35572 RepID=A0A9Q0N0I9_9DIPT|nr:hypothetical protein Bhyg_05587 [Pseudolycoriella hygida]
MHTAIALEQRCLITFIPPNSPEFLLARELPIGK